MRMVLMISLFLFSFLVLVFSMQLQTSTSVSEPTSDTNKDNPAEPEATSTLSEPPEITASSEITKTTEITSNPNMETTQPETTANRAETGTILLPPASGMYFGAFADFDAYEDKVSVEAVENFEALIGKDIAWGYFSNNWFNGIEFPHQQVQALKSAGVTPYIRLMPRTNFSPTPVNWVYTHERIADGVYDEELRTWARAARDTGTPLIIEFGTEVNGDWFPWNGKYNGGGVTTEYGDDTKPDGPERFIAAYRHIIDLFREEGATNVTWVYHLNAISSPNVAWNGRMSYYPGDAYIDWIGVSVYGAQRPRDPWTSFTSVFDEAYREITAATQKPIAVVEFGVAEGRNDKDSKAEWLEETFSAFKGGSYPRVRALSYWHSRWTNADGSVSNLRIDSSAESLAVFEHELQHPMFVSQTRFGPR